MPSCAPERKVHAEGRVARGGLAAQGFYPAASRGQVVPVPGRTIPPHAAGEFQGRAVIEARGRDALDPKELRPVVEYGGHRPGRQVQCLALGLEGKLRHLAREVEPGPDRDRNQQRAEERELRRQARCQSPPPAPARRYSSHRYPTRYSVAIWRKSGSTALNFLRRLRMWVFTVFRVTTPCSAASMSWA